MLDFDGLNDDDENVAQPRQQTPYPHKQQQQNVESTAKEMPLDLDAAIEEEVKKLEREKRKIRRTTMFELPETDGSTTKTAKRRSVIQNTPLRTKNQWNAMEKAVNIGKMRNVFSIDIFIRNTRKHPFQIYKCTFVTHFYSNLLVNKIF